MYDAWNVYSGKRSNVVQTRESRHFAILLSSYLLTPSQIKRLDASSPLLGERQRGIARLSDSCRRFERLLPLSLDQGYYLIYCIYQLRSEKLGGAGSNGSRTGNASVGDPSSDESRVSLSPPFSIVQGISKTIPPRTEEYPQRSLPSFIFLQLRWRFSLFLSRRFSLFLSLSLFSPSRICWNFRCLVGR